MGDRTSEMTDSYTKKVVKRDTVTCSRTVPCSRTAQLHAPGGAARARFGTPDNLLITQIHPYLSTTNKHHRPFTTWVCDQTECLTSSIAVFAFSSEQTRRYPAKDALTFWEMEGYPRVWGHGSVDGKNIPSRKRHDRTQTMTDATLGGNEIKSQVSQIRARPGYRPVPNMGM